MLASVLGVAENGSGTTGTGATGVLGTTPMVTVPSALVATWSTTKRLLASISVASRTDTGPVPLLIREKFPEESVVAVGSPASRVPSWLRSRKTTRPARPGSPASSDPLALRSRYTVPEMVDADVAAGVTVKLPAT